MEIKPNPVGRPKEEARDAAIFIARRWREYCLGESKKSADEWIIEQWRDAGATGVTEPSHIRKLIRQAKETWLDDCVFLFNDAYRITDNG